MMNNLPYSDALRNRRAFWIHDDFDWYVSAHRWTTVASDGGSVAVGDTANGVVVLTPSDGSVADNDETYLKSTNEVYLIADGNPLLFDCNLQFAEAATDDANILAGFMNAIAADSLVNDGGGPKASFSGAVFYKVDGGTVWRCRSSVGTNYIDSVTTITAGGSAYQNLRIEIRPVSSTLAEVSFFIDGAQCLDSTTGKPIKHQLTYTGATEMNAGWGVKNGGANLETLNVDVVDVGHLR